MSSLHGVPKQYGMIVIIFGIIFFFPLIGFTIELLEDLANGIGWSVFMFILTMIALIASIMMIGFGTNIIYYHDKKSDDRTIEELGEKSEYKPENNN